MFRWKPPSKWSKKTFVVDLKKKGRNCKGIEPSFLVLFATQKRRSRNGAWKIVIEYAIIHENNFFVKKTFKVLLSSEKFLLQQKTREFDGQLKNVENKNLITEKNLVVLVDFYFSLKEEKQTWRWKGTASQRLKLHISGLNF